MAHQILGLVAHVVHRPQGQHRQDDAAQQQAQHAQHPLIAAEQADLGREDQVAGTEHGGEQGQAHDDGILPEIFLVHLLTSQA